MDDYFLRWESTVLEVFPLHFFGILRWTWNVFHDKVAQFEQPRINGKRHIFEDLDEIFFSLNYIEGPTWLTIKLTPLVPVVGILVKQNTFHLYGVESDEQSSMKITIRSVAIQFAVGLRTTSPKPFLLLFNWFPSKLLARQHAALVAIRFNAIYW